MSALHIIIIVLLAIIQANCVQLPLWWCLCWLNKRRSSVEHPHGTTLPLRTLETIRLCVEVVVAVEAIFLFYKIIKIGESLRLSLGCAENRTSQVGSSYLHFALRMSGLDGTVFTDCGRSGGLLLLSTLVVFDFFFGADLVLINFTAAMLLALPLRIGKRLLLLQLPFFGSFSEVRIAWKYLRCRWRWHLLLPRLLLIWQS